MDWINRQLIAIRLADPSKIGKKNRPEGRLFQAIADYLGAAAAEAADAAVLAAEAAALAAEAAIDADVAAASAAVPAAEAAIEAAAASAAAAAAGGVTTAGAGVTTAGGGVTTVSSFLLHAAKATANRAAINSVFFMGFPSKKIKKYCDE